MKESRLHISVRMLILQACALLLIGGLILTQYRLSSFQTHQQAAARWSAGGERFAQLSLFLDRDAALTAASIGTMQSAIDTALTQASIAPASESARLRVDAWHASSVQTFTSDRASLRVTAVGVGGDFFHFHPFELHDGFYFSDSDVLYDRILLDESAAWQLFGSFDVEGMEVRVGMRPFIVCGVIADETDFATAAAREGETAPRIYMSYRTLSELDAQAGICCYEAVLPDPVAGFGRKLLTDALTADASQYILVENSSRFRPSALLGLIAEFGQRSMRHNAVCFPYWENAARMVEEYAAAVQLCWMLLCLIPLSGLTVLLTKLWKLLRVRLRELPDLYDRIRTEHYLKKQEKRLNKHKTED